MQDKNISFPMGSDTMVTIHDTVVSEYEVQLFRNAMHRYVIEVSAQIVNRSKESNPYAHNALFFERRQCQDFVELLDGVGNPVVLTNNFALEPWSPDNIAINNQPISDVIQATVIKALESYRDTWAPQEEMAVCCHLLCRMKRVTKLTADQTKMIDDAMNDVSRTYSEAGQFVIARIKFMYLLRLQGKTDEEIAREVTVEFRDNGAMVRQIFSTANIGN